MPPTDTDTKLVLVWQLTLELEVQSHGDALALAESIIKPLQTQLDHRQVRLKAKLIDQRTI